MLETVRRQRKSAVLLVALALIGSLPLAIFLNGNFGNWSFASFETRSLVLMYFILLAFGAISESVPLRLRRQEVVEGYLVFGLFVTFGLVAVTLYGWWLGPLLFFLQLLFCLSLVLAFHCGRWLGRIPWRKFSAGAADG